ncbi:tRNA-dihydrouridine synthase 4 [Lodderomyces elongisporus NRRL YB-4239]|uniref:tRNA-dihydrouridine synthase n=1 Tax=Lodderomyces elongisporus (strain ATCC 11503 / CBS 2605 / JCM 1781 / NBRC 1676 / NRRL YB-4239) TaxID=379508 RepID=A5E258_LODEL|nr:tRNA-dihydrouridine synthase 4 [Lodderomyces elongisporus NRRL YB-4239]
MPVPSAVPNRPRENRPTEIIKRCNAEGRRAHVAGPMVRYSKLPFRELCRFYNVDIIYTPMILAREFVRNEMARYSDFTTNDKDTCVIVQVGVNNVEDFMKFIEMIHPYVDGIGINCGCPIRDQIREGIGAALMSEPDLVAEMIATAKKQYGDSICIDTKIRIHNDLSETIEFVKKVEAAGTDIITIHGRTKTTRSSIPVNLDAIKLVRSHITKVPVIANGDCFTLEDCERIADYTGVNGVMSARGILANPALFQGFNQTPWSAVEVFMHLTTCYGLPYKLSQHHVAQMMENMLIPRKVIKEVNESKTMIDMIDTLDKYFYLKRKGEKGFATAIEPAWKEQPL